MKSLYMLLVLGMMFSPVNALTINGKVVSINPDSPLWGLDKAIEQIRLTLTPNKASKVSLQLSHAEERIQEVQEMVLKNNTNASLKALDSHNKTFHSITGDIDKIMDSQDLIRAKEALESHELRMEAQKQKVLDTIPIDSPARDSITEAFDRSIDNAQSVGDDIDIKTLSNDEIRTRALNDLGEEIGVNANTIYNRLVSGEPVSDTNIQNGIDWINENDYDLSSLDGKTVIIHLIKEGQQFQAIHLLVENNTISIVEDPSDKVIDIDIDVANLDNYVDIGNRGDTTEITKTMITLGGRDLVYLM